MKRPLQRFLFAAGSGLAIAFLLQCQSVAEAAARADGLAAWNTVYQVLQHPRCKNCHPDGDVPLQGDDSRPHAQGVRGGPEGKGLFAMRCDACHQTRNVPGAHMPPGAPNWKLPNWTDPDDGVIHSFQFIADLPEFPMVFEGRSPAQLAKKLGDPRQNGRRTPAQLLHRLAEDELVGWGWNPGEGRTPVPIPRTEFVAAAKRWIDSGCPVPE